MNDKLTALEIIRFGKPERVLTGFPAHGISYFGVNHESPDDGIGHDRPLGSKWKDIWGTEWHKDHEGVMGFPRGNPLADLSTLKSYKWPDPEKYCGQIYKNTEGWDRNEKFLVGSHRDTLWEKSYMICGMENMMCNFFAEPGAVREILHRIMNFQMSMAKHYVAAGVEMVSCSDDLGTQSAPLLSPEIVKEFLVPEYRRLFEFYKKHNVLINFHSCGHIEPLLEIFMELGINILNPIQATANNLEEVRRRTLGRMALMGGISSKLISEGTAEQIRTQVRKNILLLGKDGGYFCAADQGMPWPRENYDALVKAVEEFGRYPLKT